MRQMVVCGSNGEAKAEFVREYLEEVKLTGDFFSWDEFSHYGPDKLKSDGAIVVSETPNATKAWNFMKTTAKQDEQVYVFIMRDDAAISVTPTVAEHFGVYYV